MPSLHPASISSKLVQVGAVIWGPWNPVDGSVVSVVLIVNVEKVWERGHAQFRDTSCLWNSLAVILRLRQLSNLGQSSETL